MKQQQQQKKIQKGLKEAEKEKKRIWSKKRKQIKNILSIINVNGLIYSVNK